MQTSKRAYRFVQRLFAEFVVLFVGYSHQDLPLLYLARGISAAADGPGRYAFDVANERYGLAESGHHPGAYRRLSSTRRSKLLMQYGTYACERSAPAASIRQLADGGHQSYERLPFELLPRLTAVVMANARPREAAN